MYFVSQTLKELLIHHSVKHEELAGSLLLRIKTLAHKSHVHAAKLQYRYGSQSVFQHSLRAAKNRQ
jgi:hypothetical protein